MCNNVQESISDILILVLAYLNGDTFVVTIVNSFFSNAKRLGTEINKQNP